MDVDNDINKEKNKKSDDFLQQLNAILEMDNAFSNEIEFNEYYPKNEKLKFKKNNHFSMINKMEKEILKYSRKGVKEFLDLDKVEVPIFPEKDFKNENIIRRNRDLINKKTELAILELTENK